MKHTVKWTLISLNLLPHTHIAIRRHTSSGVDYLGGGDFMRVVKRFGDMEIIDSAIIDNILIIHVR